MAPKALMSSKASRAVNERFWRMSSSVSLQPDSKLERGSRDSGRSRISRASSSMPDCLARLRMPRQRGELSVRPLGPRMKAILRCPREYKCSRASWPPTSLSTMTELIVSFFNSQPIMAIGMLLFSRSASKLMSRKSQLAMTINPSMRRSSSISR